MSILYLVTRAGALDVTLHPAGIPSFAEWDAAAADLVVLRVPVRLVSLDDIIRSKEAAGREKDHLVLPMLWLLRDQLRRRSK